MYTYYTTVMSSLYLWMGQEEPHQKQWCWPIKSHQKMNRQTSQPKTPMDVRQKYCDSTGATDSELHLLSLEMFCMPMNWSLLAGIYFAPQGDLDSAMHNM